MRMKARSAAVGVAFLLSASAVQAEEFRWSGRVAAGQTVEVRGVNGSIDASGSAGGDVEVTARRTGRRSDPASVEIKVVEHAGGVTVCALYPAPPGEPANDCGPGGGRMNTRDNDVNVHFVVKVPPGVRFSGRNVNGDVEARGLEADVDVKTVNGSVEADSRGQVRAHTVNGSVKTRMGRADWSGELELKSVNGSITVDLPADVSTAVEASTVNGEIETDFPLGVQGRLSRRRLSSTIGSGGRTLSLQTVNGSIRLRRG